MKTKQFKPRKTFFERVIDAFIKSINVYLEQQGHRLMVAPTFKAMNAMIIEMEKYSSPNWDWKVQGLVRWDEDSITGTYHYFQRMKARDRKETESAKAE